MFVNTYQSIQDAVSCCSFTIALQAHRPRLGSITKSFDWGRAFWNCCQPGLNSPWSRKISWPPQTCSPSLWFEDYQEADLGMLCWAFNQTNRGSMASIQWAPLAQHCWQRDLRMWIPQLKSGQSQSLLWRESSILIHWLLRRICSWAGAHSQPTLYIAVQGQLQQWFEGKVGPGSPFYT